VTVRFVDLQSFTTRFCLRFMLNQFFNQSTARTWQALQTCLCFVVMLGWTTSNAGITEAQQVRFDRQASFNSSAEDNFYNRVANLEEKLDRVGPTVSSLPPVSVVSEAPETPMRSLPTTLQGFQHNRPTAAMDTAAPQPEDAAGVPFSDLVSDQAEQLMTREGTSSSVKIAILLATLSLAPAIILMTTSYVRIIVVLTLLRQAFGSQQLPSTQILTALSLFVTFLVMAPTWNQIKTEAVDPYSTGEIQWEDAWQRGLVPVKHFMSRQIEIADNEDAVAMFYRYLPHQTGNKPESLQEVPVNVLLPAYLVSELKVAFLLGFQIFLPFLIVDLVVSAVTVSMGMVMLPPTMVSFPMKLILFVLVDGWNLVVSMLLQSFGSSYG